MLLRTLVKNSSGRELHVNEKFDFWVISDQKWLHGQSVSELNNVWIYLYGRTLMSYCLQSVQCTGKHVHSSNINRWNASYRIFLINTGRAEYMQAVGGRLRPTGLPGICAGSRRSYSLQACQEYVKEVYSYN